MNRLILFTISLLLGGLTVGCHSEQAQQQMQREAEQARQRELKRKQYEALKQQSSHWNEEIEQLACTRRKQHKGSAPTKGEPHTMRKKLIVVVLAASLSGGVLSAQFGAVPVVDFGAIYQAVQQLEQLQQQYTQLVQTYQQITNQYNQMLRMAQQVPVNMVSRYRALLTPWHNSTASNTYGTTSGWIGAINTGTGVASGYLSAAEQLLSYGAALGNVPADQLDRLKKHYATVELAEGANQHTIETIGMLRHNAPQVENAIAGLEEDSLSAAANYNTEIAVLNKINAASVIGLRNTQDTNKILAALAEQQVVAAKRQRDAEAQAINNHIQFMAEAKTALHQQSSQWTAEILAYRP